MDKIKKQIDFLTETEKLKEVFRRSLLRSGRRENDAEHSWSLCMYAMVLREYAEEDTDTDRCIKMLIVHDLVEIYAGDTFLYDEEGRKSKAAREKAAAERLFGLLGEQGEEFKALWEEFEENVTKEAVFSNAMDRLQPVILNYFSEGATWREAGVTKEMVLERGKESLLRSHPKLRELYIKLLDECERLGYLAKSR